MVADKEAGWDRADECFVSYAMGTTVNAKSNAEVSVAMRVPRGCPEPAVGGLNADFIPEAFGESGVAECGRLKRHRKVRPFGVAWPGGLYRRGHIYYTTIRIYQHDHCSLGTVIFAHVATFIP